ncbi:MAG: response regulator, partial [Thermosynechococcaceae cyanobacterium]
MNTILVIEDQLDVRENIIELLQAENFNTLEAENGFEGIQLVQQTHPDLVLCDITMPELCGYDVLTMLRKNPETALIPFIFLTAKVEMTNIRQGMNLGADDYLTKPFTRVELLQTIKTRLSKHKVFEKHTEDQFFSLQQSISYSIPVKILDPLLEIKKISEILIQDSTSIQSADITSLSQHIY